MPHHKSSPEATATLFVGDVSRDASEDGIKRAFSYYGKIKNVWLSRSPWGYGFIDFEDGRDASDALKALDGRTVCGGRIRVEFSHGRGKGRRIPTNLRRPFNPHDECYECGDRGHYAYDCEQRLRKLRQSPRSAVGRFRSRSPGRKRRSRSKSARSRSTSKNRLHHKNSSIKDKKYRAN
ncbi:unnamed protein product [Didymodactylos carnosus]|nr:unnamed protein product [Didymodactylos carnosus]CAF3744541.1 unnamed protein product [Didymodactylos carnosus]